MAKKIVATGTSLVITDTLNNNAVVFEHPLKDLWFSTEELDGDTPTILIVHLTLTIKKGYRVLLSDSLDGASGIYTAATWRTFAQSNLGKSS